MTRSPVLFRRSACAVRLVPRCAPFSCLVAAALGFAFASGAAAQNDPIGLTKNAPPVAPAGAPTATLVSQLDEELQTLGMNSASERARLAVRIVKLCNALARTEDSPPTRSLWGTSSRLRCT